MSVSYSYKGIRIGGETLVSTPLGRPLDLASSLAVANHSPTGFEWGYGGSGPAQLALALLLDVLGDEERARAHYQAFKDHHVARWGDTWTITPHDIRAFVALEETASEPSDAPPGALAEEVDEEDAAETLATELACLGQALEDLNGSMARLTLTLERFLAMHKGGRRP